MNKKKLKRFKNELLSIKQQLKIEQQRSKELESMLWELIRSVDKTSKGWS